jgi:4-hydroxybenzoate polyprenyltransferase
MFIEKQFDRHVGIKTITVSVGINFLAFAFGFVVQSCLFSLLCFGILYAVGSYAGTAMVYFLLATALCFMAMKFYPELRTIRGFSAFALGFLLSGCISVLVLYFADTFPSDPAQPADSLFFF